MQVDGHAAEAWLEEAGGGLALLARLPYRPYANVVAEALRCTPHAAGGLDLRDASYLELID